jgi:ribosomal-protein-alanine N-acetyltransferase
VTRRIELLTPAAARALATPLALMHRDCFPADPWDAQAIAGIAGLTGFFGLLAAEAGEPAGFAFAFGHGDEYEIAALGVVCGRRCTGIGRALVAALCAEVRRRGGRRLVLEVAADNAAARSLYAASGFVQAGWRRDYYRRAGSLVDAQVLRLTLPSASYSI